ncbi:MAG TPA: EamA family transporter [Gaiellaceae bacterium]|nr:EamA family transporter [Gaiellaceae bacterium]
MSEAPLPVEPAAHRHVRLGYIMAASAATLWAVNGTVSKVILASGTSSIRLTEVRSTGALVGLVLVLLVRDPSRLRVRMRDLPALALFGICGLAFVQWFYFLAIHRLAIGIALLVQYLAPLLVALWARFALHEAVRQRIWLALALGGLGLIVDVGKGGTISTTGLVFCAGAAVTYALYRLLAEHAVADLGALPLLAWGFGFATLFWTVTAPWWSFPAHRVGADVSLLGHLAERHLPIWALMAWMIVPGTIVPFFLIVSALRHLPATRVAIIAMVEPVVATVVAWAWLGESLSSVQLAGGVGGSDGDRARSNCPLERSWHVIFLTCKAGIYCLQRWVTRPIGLGRCTR